ncbi:MAG: phosphoglucosamine mutase [Proteobacteria bacterium]|nr:phosphoglucosamine mutase [Pseudomonadota bacterium]
MGKLFGTDGIRGVANEYPMTPEIAVKIGRSVAYRFMKKASDPVFIIGKDTRMSGDMLEYALASGICSIGANVLLTGILPTPGIAYLSRTLKANAGIVVSASHNPFFDNGIKLFDENGYKLTDEVEDEIEDLVLNKSMLLQIKPGNNIGNISVLNDSAKRYSDFLKSSLPDGFTLNGLKIVTDCSNGATYKIAPELLSDIGADIDILYNSPDGKNINENCGSEHTESLINKVLENKADIGIAFDGDGDRLIAVDENGKILSGDKMLAISAIIMKKNGRLTNNHVVSTVMSNLGLVSLFKEKGINHTMTQVGDRYVIQEMIKTGSVIGGEDSGHIIFSNYQTTGDGILTALKLIQFMKEESKPLSELGKIMTVYPQVLMNIHVSRKPEIDDVPELADTVKHIENILGEKGRVLVRYSGTQSICRVMVEGPDKEETTRLCQQIADKVRRTIGTDA